MKKIIFDNKEIEISDESFEAFKQQFLPKDKRWVPEYGEKYWYVNNVGNEDWRYYKNDVIDNFRINTGNCFKTREEAEKHQDKLFAIAEVTAYMYENDLVLEPDWSDKKQRKYYIYYYNEYKKFSYEYHYYTQYCNILPYLKSSEACQQVIKEKEEALNKIFNK